MEFICDVAHFGMHFESVQLAVKLNSTTVPLDSTNSMSTKPMNEMKLSANTSDGARIRPITFWHAFQIRPSQCGTFLHDGFHRKLQTPYVRNQGMKWNWVPNTPMEFICTLAHFGMHFESVWVGVKLCPWQGPLGNTNSMHGKSSNVMKQRANIPNGIHMCPSSF